MTNILRNIVFVLFVIALVLGCSVQPESKGIAGADKLLAKGQLTQASAMANDLLKSHKLSGPEKEGKMDLLTIDGKRTYFSSSVRNLFLLDTAYARLRAQKEASSIDSFTIFKLNHTSK